MNNIKIKLSKKILSIIIFISFVIISIVIVFFINNRDFNIIKSKADIQKKYTTAWDNSHLASLVASHSNDFQNLNLVGTIPSQSQRNIDPLTNSQTFSNTNLKKNIKVLPKLNSNVVTGSINTNSININNKIIQGGHLNLKLNFNLLTSISVTSIVNCDLFKNSDFNRDTGFILTVSSGHSTSVSSNLNIQMEVSLDPLQLSGVNSLSVKCLAYYTDKSSNSDVVITNNLTGNDLYKLIGSVQTNAISIYSCNISTNDIYNVSLQQIISLNDRFGFEVWACRRGIANLNNAISSLSQNQKKALVQETQNIDFGNSPPGISTQDLQNKINDVLQIIINNSNYGFYSEILSYTSINIIDRGVLDGTCGYIELDGNTVKTASQRDLRQIIMQELFHSFNCINKGPTGALDEGSATFVWKYGFTDEYYPEFINAGFAESTYGTVLYYKQIGIPGYSDSIPLTAAINPTSKLVELYKIMTNNDYSKLPWDSTNTMQNCYNNYFKNLNRNVLDFDHDWILGQVMGPNGGATKKMLQDPSCHIQYEPLACVNVNVLNSNGQALSDGMTVNGGDLLKLSVVTNKINGYAANIRIGEGFVDANNISNDGFGQFASTYNTNPPNVSNPLSTSYTYKVQGLINVTTGYISFQGYVYNQNNLNLPIFNSNLCTKKLNVPNSPLNTLSVPGLTPATTIPSVKVNLSLSALNNISVDNPLTDVVTCSSGIGNVHYSVDSYDNNLVTVPVPQGSFNCSSGANIIVGIAPSALNQSKTNTNIVINFDTGQSFKIPVTLNLTSLYQCNNMSISSNGIAINNNGTIHPGDSLLINVSSIGPSGRSINTGLDISDSGFTTGSVGNNTNNISFNYLNKSIDRSKGTSIQIKGFTNSQAYSPFKFYSDKCTFNINVSAMIKVTTPIICGRGHPCLN